MGSGEVAIGSGKEVIPCAFQFVPMRFNQSLHMIECGTI